MVIVVFCPQSSLLSGCCFADGAWWVLLSGLSWFPSKIACGPLLLHQAPSPHPSIVGGFKSLKQDVSFGLEAFKKVSRLTMMCGSKINLFFFQKLKLLTIEYDNLKNCVSKMKWIRVIRHHLMMSLVKQGSKINNFCLKVARLDFLGGIPPKFEHNYIAIIKCII